MDIISTDRDLRLCPVRVLALPHLLPLIRSLTFFVRKLEQRSGVNILLYQTLLLQKPSRRWPFNNDEAPQGSTLP